MKQEQADLSGTYTGKVRHGKEPAMDATLTITGNNFTMTAGSETNSGRITAVTTCGYTGVTMMMGDLTPPTPSPNPPAALPAMSLRAQEGWQQLDVNQRSRRTEAGLVQQHRRRRREAKGEKT